MKTMLRCVAEILLCASLALPAAAQDDASAVTLDVSGRFARGGSFVGSATINRFEQRGNQIVAIGLVRGSLTRGNRTLGSALIGAVT